MIISKRDKGTTVACQQVRDDLALFSSVFGWYSSLRLWKALYGEIKKIGVETPRHWDKTSMVSIGGQAKGEWHVKRAISQGWVRTEQRANLLQSRCFVVLFFSADTVMETGSFFLFFIGRMPFHYDLWMQTLCRLILLSMHYVAQPSMAIWGREESPPTPATHTVSKALSPSVDSFLLLRVSLFASFPLQHKAS